MNVLVIGFPDSELRSLSDLLSAAGHGVLAASGREGARTFAAAMVPDVVAIPEGPRGVEAAGWLDPLPPASRVVTVEAGPQALDRITGAADGAAPVQPARPRRRGKASPEAPPSTLSSPSASEAVIDPVLVAPYVAPPASIPAVDPAPRPVEAGMDRLDLHPELAAKLGQVRLADYFTLLEVEPEASTWVIREGHERLVRRFSARGWPHRLTPLELEALDEVGRGLADALLVLGDDELRGRYQRALAAAAQGLAPGPSSGSAPRGHG